MIFRAAVDFGLALLAAKTFHFSHRQTLYAKRGQRFSHLVELEGLDDSHNEFHRAFRSSLWAGTDPAASEEFPNLVPDRMG
jgi:hypothetical protein